MDTERSTAAAQSLSCFFKTQDKGFEINKIKLIQINHLL